MLVQYPALKVKADSLINAKVDRVDRHHIQAQVPEHARVKETCGFYTSRRRSRVVLHT